jgi:hypothetical protein
MNTDNPQFPKATLVDILNSGKEPKPTNKGIPTLKEILDSDKEKD